MIQSCFIEILDYGEVNLLEDDHPDREEKIKNHVVLRLLFRKKLLEGTSDAQRGTTGVRISFDLDTSVSGAGANEMGGQFLVKTITYNGASFSAVKVFELRLGDSNLSLRQFVRPPLAAKMFNFFFVFDGHGYMGCRDFM